MGIINSIRNKAATWLLGASGPGYLSAIVATARTTSGETVSPDSALNASAYYACLRNLSEDLSQLPVDVYAKRGRRRESQDDHRVEYLLNVSPNPEMGAMSVRETLQHWAMGWGNGYAEIERDGAHRPMWLWPIHPSRTMLMRNDAGDIVLRVLLESGGLYDLPYENVFHVHGLGGDGLQGYSIARVGCEAIGKALAQQKFAAAFFGNGATFGNVMEYPQTLKPEAKAALRKSIAESHSGAGNAFKTFVLENGGKLSTATLGIPPEEAQLLESMNFSVEELARWFRVPPHMIGHLARAQGWSTLEMQGMEYVTYCLMPWAIRWEQEIARKLFSSAEVMLRVKHNFRALLRGDNNSRADYYGKMLRLGVMTRNDIRSLEDENPVEDEGGDMYYIESSNLRPIGKDGLPVSAPGPERAEPNNEPAPPDAEPDETPPEPETGEPSSESRVGPIVMFRPLIEDACGRVAAHDARQARKLVGMEPEAVSEFYTKHRAYLLRALAPIAESWTDATGQQVSWVHVDASAGEREAAVSRGDLSGDYEDKLIAAAIEDLSHA